MTDGIDNELLTRLSCLTTSDKDTILGSFEAIVAPKVVPIHVRRFYLEMNNWNLQDALTSYFDMGNGPEETDYEHELHNFHSQLALSIMTEANPTSLPGDRIISPGVQYCCSWNFQNTGSVAWPAGCTWLQTEGGRLHYEISEVPALKPCEECILSFQFISPLNAGEYTFRFQMITPSNYVFGESIWLRFTVAESAENATDNVDFSFLQNRIPLESGVRELALNNHIFFPIDMTEVDISMGEDCTANPPCTPVTPPIPEERDDDDVPME